MKERKGGRLLFSSQDLTPRPLLAGTAPARVRFAETEAVTDPKILLLAMRFLQIRRIM